MQDITKIRKGLDIPLEGCARKIVSDARSIGLYAVKPTDYVGLAPRPVVAEGDTVLAGSPLFVDKNNACAKFVSPVSGTVKAVVRGEKRALLAVVVASDGRTECADSAPDDLALLSREQVRQRMVDSGCWTLLRRRPFGIVPLESDNPKAIFVSCFDSAPLAPDYDFVMMGREEDFGTGVEVLAKLTDGPVHLGMRPGQALSQLDYGPQVEIHFFEGPHPAGNVGTQIAAVDPIDKGDVVWTISPQEVAIVGHLFRSGQYRPEKLVALTGPCAASPRYYRIFSGAELDRLCGEQMASRKGCRLISGNVLSGTTLPLDSPTLAPFLGAHDDMVTLIPEGDYYEFMGWLMPGLSKFSFHRTFLSGWLRHLPGVERFLPKMRYDFDTNLHGEPRPLVMTGEFEQVFPFDIYPLQLLKAAIIGDVDLMENLGIYEVEPEDFALCEYIDPSKTDIQCIVRTALENIRKEGI